jgi:hypothetical protein
MESQGLARDPVVRELVDFLHESERGRRGRGREGARRD